jgi:hypothetical protein
MNPMNQLDQEEREALKQFATQQGRQWRIVLQQMWMSGNYWGTDTNAPALQRVRNKIGPSGIYNIRPHHLANP